MTALPEGAFSQFQYPTVPLHEIRPALTDNATAVNRTLKANATELACPCSGKAMAPQLAPEN